MSLPLLALTTLLGAAPSPPVLEPQLAAARADLFEHSDAKAAAALADAVLDEQPTSSAALELSYVAHWMLDDEGIANQRFLELAARGGPAAGLFLLDGWGRLRTSEDEGKRIEEIRASSCPSSARCGAPSQMSGHVPP